MMELENHHSSAIIIVSSKNYQWMLKLIGEKVIHIKNTNSCATILVYFILYILQVKKKVIIVSNAAN